jgi:hypothetical protein
MDPVQIDPVGDPDPHAVRVVEEYDRAHPIAPVPPSPPGEARETAALVVVILLGVGLMVQAIFVLSFGTGGAVLMLVFPIVFTVLPVLGLILSRQWGGAEGDDSGSRMAWTTAGIVGALAVIGFHFLLHGHWQEAGGQAGWFVLAGALFGDACFAAILWYGFRLLHGRTGRSRSRRRLFWASLVPSVVLLLIQVSAVVLFVLLAIAYSSGSGAD